MRALLHADFEANKSDIYVRQVIQLHQSPGPICTRFDYTSGSLRHITTTAAPPPPSQYEGEEDLRTAWEDLSARVERSGGRMELAVMEVSLGETRQRILLLPLRSSSPIVHDGLRQIAKGLPADHPQGGDLPETTIEEIRTLVRASKDQVVQIYC